MNPAGDFVSLSDKAGGLDRSHVLIFLQVNQVSVLDSFYMRFYKVSCVNSLVVHIKSLHRLFGLSMYIWF